LNIRHNDYSINYLEFPERWIVGTNPVSIEPDFLHDSQGIIITSLNGRYYYHPWAITNKALEYISSYHLTSDSRYLPLIYRYAQKISELGHRAEGSIWLPYQMDVLLNWNSNMILLPPWYSGLAEGMALSFMSRAYEITGDSYFKAKADSFFVAFTQIDSSKNIWVTMVDSGGYFWIEEYPFRPPNHVLNGFITTICCIYDYYLINHDKVSGKVIRGGITTIANYCHLYRNPGGVSYYDLLFKPQYPNYHGLHINQFRQLTKITGDSSFSAFADSLYSDYIPTD